MGLRVCYLGASKGKEKEEEGASKLATHCYEMITDGISRFAKKRKAGTFGQGCLCLGGEDEASSDLGLVHGLIHIARNGWRRGKVIASTIYKGNNKKQQEM